MGKIIHIIISIFFKILIPIFYIAFILAGIISALVSALIEYEVFSELFQKNINERFYLSIPFLIVIVFESTKVFLIFLNKQYSKSGNNNYIVDRKHFRRLRYSLVIISALATLIFSFYNLHNPEYETAYQRAKTEIEQNYSSQIKEVNESFDNQIQLQISPINEDIKRYSSNMTTEEKYKFKGRQEYRGPRYNEAKNLRAAAETKRIEVISSLNEQREARILALNTKRMEETSQIKQNLKTSSASGNKMLSATLEVINMKAEFPRWQFIAVIALISLFLSVGLEYIIWSAFTVLAINHGDIFELDINRQDWKEKHKLMYDTIDKMTETEANSYKNRASNWSKTILNVAKRKAKEYRDGINLIFR